jgi:hypothetical protein
MSGVLLASHLYASCAVFVTQGCRYAFYPEGRRQLCLRLFETSRDTIYTANRSEHQIVSSLGIILLNQVCAKWSVQKQKVTGKYYRFYQKLPRPVAEVASRVPSFFPAP